MLAHWVRRFMAAEDGTGAVAPVAAQACADRELPRYPPADPGLPLRPPPEILAANADLLQRLRLHAAVEPREFGARFEAPLLRLAEQVNVLPATGSSLFAGEAGLFRAALESAFFAFQAADGRIFTGAEGVERRHALEGRWRYLCFLAGLLQPLGKPLERIVVTGSAGQVWQRHFGSLSDWAAAQGVDRVFLAWAGPDDERAIGPASASVALLPTIVGPDNLQLLEDGKAGLVPALYQLAAGAAGSAPIAHQVVNNCWQRIQRQEAARRPQAFGRLTVGSHQGPYLAGALRALVQQGHWRPNSSVLKTDGQALYLQWPQAATDLVAFGRARGYPGWPDDAPTLAALLQAAGLVQAGGRELGQLALANGHGEIIQALQLTDPLAVLDPRGLAAAQDPEQAWRPLGASASPRPAPRTLATAAHPLPAPSSLDLFAELPPVQSELQGFEPAVAAAIPAASATAIPVPPANAAEPASGELVPAELAAAIGAPAQVELLRKLVRTWHERGPGCTSMRRIDTGAAIDFAFLAARIPDVPGWVDCMARAGLVHAPAKTPGLRIQKVVLCEGQPPVPAVVLSALACRRLGL